MKKLWMVLLILGIFSSCEDVIEVDLNDAPPRLVIEANMYKWKTGESSALVKLTTTAPFFDNDIPVVSDAEVKLSDENDQEYTFEYINNGIYRSSFSPEPNVEYTLRISYKGETYTATEKLYTTSELEYVEQRNDGGFLGEDIELKVFYKDPAQEKNFYFFEGLCEKGDILSVYRDEFFNGNLIFAYYVVEDVEPGDDVIFHLYGASEQFYNFMYVLLQQTGGQGGPFQTQPATVRGNIVNLSNPDNFPLGYYRISEVSTLTYIVK